MLAGGTAAAYFSEPTFANVLAGIAGGYAGAALPDIFEPATSPFHRSLFHSWTFATGGAVATPTGVKKLKTYAEQRVMHYELRRAMDPANGFWYVIAILFWKYVVQFVIGLIAGYASHLALDATTPMGLPFFR